MTLRDPDIRQALLATIDARNGLWVTEFTVPGARADVVELSTTDLIVYEIKSDVDTPVRLARQADAYDGVATHMFLVTTPKKLAKMEEIVPPWWGILLATETDSGVTLSEHRDSRGNPAWSAHTALKLLWAPELDSVISDHGLRDRSTKPKKVKRQHIISSLGKEGAQSVCFQRLVLRYQTHPELRGSGKRSILP